MPNQPIPRLRPLARVTVDLSATGLAWAVERSDLSRLPEFQRGWLDAHWDEWSLADLIGICLDGAIRYAADGDRVGAVDELLAVIECYRRATAAPAETATP